jgi:hypothetical protein
LNLLGVNSGEEEPEVGVLADGVLVGGAPKGT